MKTTVIVVTTGASFGFGMNLLSKMFLKFDILIYVKMSEDKFTVYIHPEDEDKFKSWIVQVGKSITFN